MMTKACWVSPFVLGLAALLLEGCSESARENKPVASLPPVSVRVVTAAKQEWPLIYEASGTVRARTSAVIAAKLMGYVREVKVQTGDRVRAGQSSDYAGRPRSGCKRPQRGSRS